MCLHKNRVFFLLLFLWKTKRKILFQTRSIATSGMVLRLVVLFFIYFFFSRKSSSLKINLDRLDHWHYNQFIHWNIVVWMFDENLYFIHRRKMSAHLRTCCLNYVSDCLYRLTISYKYSFLFLRSKKKTNCQ